MAGHNAHFEDQLMNASDYFVAENHLDMALRHLESASALAAGLAPEADFASSGHEELQELTAEAGVLVERISRTVAGIDLDDDLRRLFDQIDT